MARAGRQSCLGAQPRAVCSQPRPVSQPVSYAAHEPFAHAGCLTHTQPVTIHHVAQPVTISGIGHIQPAVNPARIPELADLSADSERPETRESLSALSTGIPEVGQSSPRCVIGRGLG